MNISLLEGLFTASQTACSTKRAAHCVPKPRLSKLSWICKGNTRHIGREGPGWYQTLQAVPVSI